MPINTCVVVYLRPHLFIRNHKMVWTQKLLRSFYSFLTTGNWELPSHGIKINCFSFLDLKSEWWVVSTGTKYQLQKVGIYHYFLDEYMLYLLATECRLPVYPTVLYLLLVQTIGWETTNKTNPDGGLRLVFFVFLSQEDDRWRSTRYTYTFSSREIPNRYYRRYV